MADLDSIEQQIKGRRDYDSPPLHLWHPPLSGDIPIEIRVDGEWYHDGGRIQRQSLVRLFASILRREEDGEYYLVTPVEKWRIQVAMHPLRVVDVDALGSGDEQELWAVLNTGRRFRIDAEHPLFLEPAVGDVAAVTLPHGLSALFSRAAWYRLVELADSQEDRTVIRSGGEEFVLFAAAT